MVRKGGAISLIDALYLSIHISSAKLKVVTHGMPRVGNPAFAALIDSKVGPPPSLLSTFIDTLADHRLVPYQQ